VAEPLGDATLLAVLLAGIGSALSTGVAFFDATFLGISR
jgi:hypothetical protein